MPTYTFSNPVSFVLNDHVTQLEDYPLRIVCANFELEPNPPKPCDPCLPIFPLPFVDGDLFYFQFINKTPIVTATVTFLTQTTLLLVQVPLPLHPLKRRQGGYIR